MPGRARLRSGLAAATALLGVLGAILVSLTTATPARADSSALQATIRRTEGGIPHIVAHNFGGLGYGFGYAFAQDDVCPMADDYVTVDAQRSRYFGPSATFEQRGNAVISTNENSDLFWQQIIDGGVVEHLLTIPPPLGLRPECHELARGYVAGWNRYLADVGGSAGVSDPSCRGAAWVQPTTEIEADRRFYQLILLASS